LRACAARVEVIGLSVEGFEGSGIEEQGVKVEAPEFGVQC
jgi:hypothetical protein